MEIIRMIAVSNDKSAKIFRTESDDLCFFNNEGKLVPVHTEQTAANYDKKKMDIKNRSFYKGNTAR